MKILNFGSLNIDYVYRVCHFVRAGETVSSEHMDRNVGGKGLNQSVALARAGCEIWHAGCIGEDGEFLREFLAENGVHTDYIRTVPGASGHAIIQVNDEGQNCILIHGGANRAMTGEYIDGVLKNFGAGDMLLVQNEVNMLHYIISRAHDRGMTTVLNPSPISGDLLEIPPLQLDYVILNEHEGEALSGEGEVAKMPSALAAAYPSVRFVLTVGEKGADYFDGKKACHADAVRVNAVDTTAAGDTFTGYFLSEITNGSDEQTALCVACRAAALSVTIHGAARSIPKRCEL